MELKRILKRERLLKFKLMKENSVLMHNFKMQSKVINKFLQKEKKWDNFKTKYYNLRSQIDFNGLGRGIPRSSAGSGSLKASSKKVSATKVKAII